mgnify:FL=1
MYFNYVIVPYACSDATLRAKQMAELAKFEASLMERGEYVISPVLRIVGLYGITASDAWEQWREYAFELMNYCSHVTVLMFDGWDTDPVVLAEIQNAKDIDTPVRYVKMCLD